MRKYPLPFPWPKPKPSFKFLVSVSLFVPAFKGKVAFVSAKKGVLVLGSVFAFFSPFSGGAKIQFSAIFFARFGVQGNRDGNNREKNKPIDKEHLKEFGGRCGSVQGTVCGRIPGHPGAGRPGDLIHV